MRIILIIIFIITCLGYTAFGLANFNGFFSFNRFIGFGACNAISGPLTINGRDIIVQNDTPNGTLLATFTSGSFKTYRCDNNTKNMISGGKLYGEFATLLKGIRVYKTNIPGIGYTLGVQTMCPDMVFPTKGWRDNVNNIDVCWSNKVWNQITHNFEVRIYKIAATASGIVEKKQIGATILAYKETSIWAEENPVFLNSFRVTTINNSNKPNDNKSNDNKLNGNIQHHHQHYHRHYHQHIWPNNNSIDINKDTNNNANNNTNNNINNNANNNTNNNINNNTNNNAYWFSHTWNRITHNFEVRIYKIGPTANGTVTKKEIGATILSYNNHNNWAEENPVFLNAFNITTVGKNSNQDNHHNHI
uniref:Putative fimbrial protein n=1 Tax=Arsenophonus nasoniae TaxID=638 RepID=D2TWJ0_9GAMM|nr:putative fimbrial protein [Arsenophonus nasoniae]